MPVKDILLHLDSSPAYDARLRLTLRLASRLEARVVGIVILPEPDAVALAESAEAAVALAAALAELEEEAADIGQKFMMVLDRHGLEGEWRRARGPTATLLARHGQAADLVVLSQRDPDHPEESAVVEEVVLACGRPVLVVPYKGRFEQAVETVVLGWNGSREAARAAQQALPLLTLSGSVCVLSVRPPDGDASDNRAAEIVQHLFRHGLRAKSDTIVAAEDDVADALLSRATDCGGKLIVMGAFSRSRLREKILGGTTLEMLEQMTIPVLMAH